MKKEDIKLKHLKALFSYLKSNYELVVKIFIPLFIILIGYFSCTYNQRKINLNIINIFSIANDVRLSYSDKPDYWGLSTEYIIKNKIINSKFLVDNKILLNPAKEIFIGSGINASPLLPQQKSFDIVLKGLNKAECISYIEANITADNQVNLSNISLINTKEYTFSWGDKTYPLPISKYIGKDICNDVNNTIIWSMF